MAAGETVARLTTETTDADVTLGAGGACAFCLRSISSRRLNGFRSLNASRIGEVAGIEVTSPDGIPAPIVRGAASVTGIADVSTEGNPGPCVTPGDVGVANDGLEGKPDLVVSGIGVEEDGGEKTELSHVKGPDELVLGLFVMEFEGGAVLATLGGRTEVCVGVMIVVMYASMTRTVGAFVSVTR